MNVDFKIVEYNSASYFAMLEIRIEVLRKPLGLHYSKQQLLDECNQIHVVACFDDKIIGGLILLKENEKQIKMRQVAIDANYQSKGIGKQLIRFAEQHARDLNCEYMHCHARETASQFYTNLEYKIKGEVFLEVGIPHFYMYKIL